MPHYYFDLHNGSGLTRDEEGQELPDMDAARRSAIESIRSLLMGEVRDGRVDLDGFIAIHDGAGSEPVRVMFDEAVEIKRS